MLAISNLSIHQCQLGQKEDDNASPDSVRHSSEAFKGEAVGIIFWLAQDFVECALWPFDAGSYSLDRRGYWVSPAQ